MFADIDAMVVQQHPFHIIDIVRIMVQSPEYILYNWGNTQAEADNIWTLKAGNQNKWYFWELIIQYFCLKKFLFGSFHENLKEIDFETGNL